MTFEKNKEIYDDNVEDIEDALSEVDDSIEMIDLGEDELTIGTVFPSEGTAVRSIQHWSEKTFCPLSKVCFTKLQP